MEECRRNQDEIVSTGKSRGVPDMSKTRRRNEGKTSVKEGGRRGRAPVIRGS